MPPAPVQKLARQVESSAWRKVQLVQVIAHDADPLPWVVVRSEMKKTDVGVEPRRCSGRLRAGWGSRMLQKSLKKVAVALNGVRKSELKKSWCVT